MLPVSKRFIVLSIIGAFVMSLTACESMNRTQKGAAIGGLSGAGLGAIIGSRSGHAGRGALIGGAAGALVGGVVGNYMDRQAAELERVAETERTGDGIVVTMRDKILFDVNSANVKPESSASLQQISDVLKKYPKTNITVAGYTDSTGSDAYNQGLSERRASSVKFMLVSYGVDGSRVTSAGFGKSNPVASNDTADGRAQNRRVELHIVPNEDLKRESG
jgi:outer membrane protein OmpA-like peptidoglycan-associated protein